MPGIQERFTFQDVSVLIVEDNQFLRKLVRSMLRQLGVQEATDVSDGLDALEALSTRDHDVILLDWVMPGFNGEEVLQIVRRSPEHKLRTIPIIVMSAFTNHSNVVRAAEAGADAVIAKPLSVSLLGRRIERVMTTTRLEVRGSDRATRISNRAITRGSELAPQAIVRDLDEIFNNGGNVEPVRELYSI